MEHQDGLKERFIGAIRENEGLIYKIALIYTNNIEDKNDLVQEIIYQLWKSFASFSNKASISTWMYRVAMNVAIYHMNIAKRRIKTVPMETQLINLQERDEEEMEEKWKLIKEHLQTLSLLEKGIIILYLEEKSHEEIAQIIGISTSNVGTKLSRIKEKLRNKIAKNTY